MTHQVAFRLSSWDTPWWANSNRNPGRFNRVGQTTQYLCLHPLGPWAEYMRREHIDHPDDLALIRQRVWVARIALTNALEITWDNAKAEFDIEPEQLVADRHDPCQSLADRLRKQGVDTLLVPSAALPGTQNVVLFGPRISSPYLPEPIDPSLDVPTSLIADHATMTDTLLASVRHIGQPHQELESWRASEISYSQP
ncbi:MAG: RES family NAD+ phosphorylase [Acidimicrobiales bacterium]